MQEATSAMGSMEVKLTVITEGYIAKYVQIPFNHWQIVIYSYAEVLP